jgi:cytochrome b6-f complex iron-sulfur subunit
MAAADAAIAPGGATTRRGLIAFFGWATIALVGLQATVAFLFFFWPLKSGTFGGKVSVGSPNDFKVGDVKYFVEGKFYLSRVEEGFMALYQRCPHVGCTVPWRPDFELPNVAPGVHGLFRCPCHGSTYLRNGQIIFGPAPRPMDYMAITNEGGKLVVNTGQIKKRDKWDPSQALKA